MNKIEKIGSAKKLSDRSNNNLAEDVALGGEDVPLYKKVKKFIIRKITNNVWLPGACIPSENIIVKEMGVSRSTVSRALRELTMEGFLDRVQGVGTFVTTKTPPIALLEIKSISEEILERGGVYSCDVLLLRKEIADDEIADAFHFPVGSPVFHSILVHRDSGKPVQLAERYVNPFLAPDYLKQDFTTITPSNYLIPLGPLEEVEHIIEAVMPDNETQRLLGISAEDPCLVLHRRTWSSNVVVTKAKFTYPSSRIKLGSRFKPNFYK